MLSNFQGKGRHFEGMALSSTKDLLIAVSVHPQLRSIPTLNDPPSSEVRIVVGLSSHFGSRLPRIQENSFIMSVWLVDLLQWLTLFSRNLALVSSTWLI